MQLCEGGGRKSKPLQHQASWWADRQYQVNQEDSKMLRSLFSRSLMAVPRIRLEMQLAVQRRRQTGSLSYGGDWARRLDSLLV
jgi:hypothetical protein